MLPFESFKTARLRRATLAGAIALVAATAISAYTAPAAAFNMRTQWASAWVNTWDSTILASSLARPSSSQDTMTITPATTYVWVAYGDPTAGASSTFATERV
jgi:hypothetical protein